MGLRILTIIICGVLSVTLPASAMDKDNSSANSTDQEKDQNHQKRMLEIEKNEATGVYQRQVPEEELGIQDDGEVAGLKGEVLNSWYGYLDGKLFGVAAGYEFSNPAAGLIVIVEGSRSGNQEFYSLPTTTGPAYIVSEENGVLEIKTQSGRYPMSDEDLDLNTSAKGKYTTVPGHGIYHFDLRTHQFR